MNKNIDVVMIGLGYIGLPTAAVMADNNIKVLGIDVNQSVVDTINNGLIHIIEPGLEEVVKNAVKKEFLSASTEIAQAPVYLIAVPTPFKGDHQPDISFVEAAIKNISTVLKENDIIIIESTSPIGTTEKMKELIDNELRPDLKNKYHIAYCPERVLPGNVLHELKHNDRVIGGINKEATSIATEFYSKFVSGELFGTNSKTAEMCKLTENASRDVQIAFANELSLISDKANINVWELISLANKHPRVNILQPGAGVGGHCIAVDPYFISSEFPEESKIISTAREINNYKSFWVAEKIQNTILQYKLEKGTQPTVALMGLAFKPNIDDLRESPAKYIVQKVMQSQNDANLLIVEPNIKDHHVFKLTDYNEATEKADIIALLVGHDEFKSLSIDNDKIVLDFCGVMNK